MWNASGRMRTAAVVVLVGIFCALASTANAQSDRFGGQARADAAARMVILGVQQGISSLPPTSGQSLTYEFDPELSTFIASEQLGPTSFRSTQTIGKGRWALRGSFTYFRLHQTFGPIKYAAEFLEPFPPGSPLQGFQPAGVAEFGLQAKAKVALLNLGVNYGLTDRVELTFNVPISVVEARAAQISSTLVAANPSAPPELGAAVMFNPFSSDPATRQEQIESLSAEFDRRIGRSQPCVEPPGVPTCLTLRKDDFDDLGFNFNEDASPGVGRMSVGAKYNFLTLRYFQSAFSTEFFAPSPNEVEFAGSESPAILPRFIFQVPAHEYFRIHADAGYDYDFDEAELRRFVWDTGASVPIGPVTLDFGVGGSIFDVPIRWTPETATSPGDRFTPPSKITAIGGNEIGDEFIDFLGGIKVRLADRLILSGAVTTPLNDQGFRADAVGTIAIEGYY